MRFISFSTLFRVPFRSLFCFHQNRHKVGTNPNKSYGKHQHCRSNSITYLPPLLLMVIPQFSIRILIRITFPLFLTSREDKRKAWFGDYGQNDKEKIKRELYREPFISFPEPFNSNYDLWEPFNSDKPRMCRTIIDLISESHSNPTMISESHICLEQL